jgi:hypothetical protein
VEATEDSQPVAAALTEEPVETKESKVSEALEDIKVLPPQDSVQQTPRLSGSTQRSPEEKKPRTGACGRTQGSWEGARGQKG